MVNYQLSIVNCQLSKILYFVQELFFVEFLRVLVAGFGCGFKQDFGVFAILCRSHSIQAATPQLMLRQALSVYVSLS